MTINGDCILAEIHSTAVQPCCVPLLSVETPTSGSSGSSFHNSDPNYLNNSNHHHSNNSACTGTGSPSLSDHVPNVVTSPHHAGGGGGGSPSMHDSVSRHYHHPLHHHHSFRRESTSITTASSDASAVSAVAAAAAAAITPTNVPAIGPPDTATLTIAIAGWYFISVVAIVTTKILLTDLGLPPIVLTFQQLLCGSWVLRCALLVRGDRALQPLPWHHDGGACCGGGGSDEFIKKDYMEIWKEHSNFLLVGIFNALDFAFSNSAFSMSAASFVETIKASDPITTTAVALIWKVDRLGSEEFTSLFLLIAGVLLSTWGNSQSSDGMATAAASATAAVLNLQHPSLSDSIHAASTVMGANLCFAFRAMNQKLYRTSAVHQMDDINLLCRMQQVGAVFLILPVVMLHSNFIWIMLNSATGFSLYYLGMFLLNSIAFSVYNLASTYVLSQLTVLHHSALNCLRRMFAIAATCVFFGIPMTFVGALGLVTSFVGFFGFNHYRSVRQLKLERKATV